MRLDAIIISILYLGTRRHRKLCKFLSVTQSWNLNPGSLVSEFGGLAVPSGGGFPRAKTETQSREVC